MSTKLQVMAITISVWLKCCSFLFRSVFEPCKLPIFIVLCYFPLLPAVAGPSLPDVNNTQVIRVVADEWEGFTKADGTGLYFDVLRLVYKPMGISVKYQMAPFLRAIGVVNGGRADVLLASWGAEHLIARSQGGHFQLDKIVVPRHAIWADYVVAVFPPGTSLSWSQVKENQAMRVAWLRGYNYQRHLGLELHRIIRLPRTNLGLKMLLQHRLDCYLDNRDEINTALASTEFRGAKLPQEVVMRRKIYPIFHNGEQGRKLLTIYDRRMEELIRSGDLFQLYRERGADYRDVLASEIAP